MLVDDEERFLATTQKILSQKGIDEKRGYYGRNNQKKGNRL
jgi:hypothetical protein